MERAGNRSRGKSDRPKSDRPTGSQSKSSRSNSSRPQSSRTPPASRTALILSVLFCAGLLFFFKYLNFFSENMALLLRSLSIPVQPLTLRLALPIGISFYLFQTISYLVDVYQGKIPAERHFGIYAVYISFFPKVMQGPIERGASLLPQLHKPGRFHYEQASYGMKLMAWGFFKKLVLADGLSIYVNQVYDNLPSYTGFSLMLATFFYAVQLYCDFSGYTDIALGSARILGIRLTPNFRSPYFASSIKDFWGRWHLSLSGWLRDYIYIPLGGNRVGRVRHALNIMITFLVSGLWHGASWNFVLWGGIHGALQVVEGFFPWNKKSSPFQTDRRLHALLCIVSVPVTFLLVCFAWIFFRAATIGDAFYVIRSMFTGIGSPSAYFHDCALQMGLGLTNLMFHCLPMIPLFLFDLASLKTDVIALISRQRFFIRWPVYILLLLVILLFSEKGVTTEFIYMQF
ncbi:MAG TPA: MBOAT family protein [Candidatus Eisenbergiella merdavium]|uniref:MBOAT family protein n=2 Tax=Eisenbergiella TaxID=1432051 RepID=A0A9D2MU41_9FIRM|nr:MBOAT family protein [Candidatus Eisenbergiella merdigallinarum]HJC22285.1 MBOAT family protein [Candidatus Eisenbergiella merdavium]